jgi:hypothetical protein
MTNRPILCPSYVAKPNIDLFGIVGADGSLLYLKNTITIDNTFIKETLNGRPAEERFRFSGKCVEKGCNHWESNKCGLIEKLIHTTRNPISENLQHCAIRDKCRWFLQENKLACSNCNEVFRSQETIFFQN